MNTCIMIAGNMHLYMNRERVRDIIMKIIRDMKSAGKRHRIRQVKRKRKRSRIMKRKRKRKRRRVRQWTRHRKPMRKWNRNMIQKRKRKSNGAG